MRRRISAASWPLNQARKPYPAHDRKIFGVPGHPYQGDAGQQIAVGFEAISNKLQATAKGPGGKAAPTSRTTYVRWGDDNRNVVVTIRDGKVVDKQQKGVPRGLAD